MLISRPTLVTLNLRSTKCKAFELSKGANHNIGSDTAIADCAMRRVELFNPAAGVNFTSWGFYPSNHEGFYPWPPRRVPRESDAISPESRLNLAAHPLESSSQSTPWLNGSIGECGPTTLGPYIVSRGWITYHHVKPQMMGEIHRALVEEEGEVLQLEDLVPAAEPLLKGPKGEVWTAKEQSRGFCARLIPRLQKNHAVARCRGVLCCKMPNC